MNYDEVEMFAFYDNVNIRDSNKYYLRNGTTNIHYSTSKLEGFAYVSTENGYWVVRVILSKLDNANDLMQQRTLEALSSLPGVETTEIDESTYNNHMKQFNGATVVRIVYSSNGGAYCVLSSKKMGCWNIYCANKFIPIRVLKKSNDSLYALSGEYNSELKLQVGNLDIPYPLTDANPDVVFNNVLMGVDYSVLRDVVQFYEYSICEFEKMKNTHKLQYL